MYPHTISSNGKIVPDYQPSFKSDSCIDTAKYLNNHLTLTQQVRNPLTCIYLAVELLESSIDVNDRKIYMDIIKRGSLRINNLVNQLVKYHQEKELQKVKII